MAMVNYANKCSFLANALQLGKLSANNDHYRPILIFCGDLQTTGQQQKINPMLVSTIEISNDYRT